MSNKKSASYLGLPSEKGNHNMATFREEVERFLSYKISPGGIAGGSESKIRIFHITWTTFAGGVI